MNPMRAPEVLEAVRRATILGALDLIDALAAAASADESHDALAAAIADGSDRVTAIVAVHAAAAAGEATAATLVAPLLQSTDPFLREHAAWALVHSLPLPDAVPALRGIADAGGFPGTLAEATLEAWGVLPDQESTGAPSAPADCPSRQPLPGLTVAQLFLHGDVDGTLSHAGQGDTGGIATLLVHLGNALLQTGGISRVITLSRERRGHPLPPPSASPGHHYAGVPLPGPVRHAADAWPLHRAARDGIRSALAAAGRVDVLHLRMADVGSWAGDEVARELGIPTVMTVAPDPHALVAAREAAGSLTRGNYAEADLVEHLTFRILLLRNLTASAAGLVVFPRPQLDRDLRDLLHLDPDADAHRLHVVAEGVDLAPLERAGREVAALAHDDPSPETCDALAELDAVLAALPPHRRGLPLAITVGRLHRVKGMATLVEAWAADEGLWARCNLLVVGGDLEEPNDDEAEQLARIDAAVARSDAPGRGVLLAGHRPNGAVAVWLAAVRHGRPGLSAPAGVYVSASLKEEFGIAILEAMASGLVVVAPNGGGPATYVEHGVTGVLVDTTSRATLAGGVRTALDLAAAPDAAVRAERARACVAERFSIQTMASTLSTLYQEISRDPARCQS